MSEHSSNTGGEQINEKEISAEVSGEAAEAAENTEVKRKRGKGKRKRAAENSAAKIAETDGASKEQSEKEEKPVYPRRRKITGNPQLVVTASAVGLALCFIIIWKLFFNQSIVGNWHLEIEGEYSESADTAAEETADDAAVEYDQDVMYTFKKDGTCLVTFGTVTTAGTYETGSTEEYGNLISATVANNDNYVFYGTYAYYVSGNAFTGRTLVLQNVYDEEDKMVLERGKRKLDFKPFENARTDPRMIGRWYDAERGLTYEFNSDGEMILTDENGLEVMHYYTLTDDGILVKYYGDSEITYTMEYEFDGSAFSIQGYSLSKLDSRSKK